ncbi:MAG: HepT-like ribonuclease domain-containing protein [Anaerolineae bacterium]
MSSEYLDYIEDILDAMGKAQLLVDGITYEQLASDFRTHFAVVRALEIIGEATKRLPEGLRRDYPEVPWREMAGMRDRIVHGYDVIDLRIVWWTVTRRIPEVMPLVRSVLSDHKDEP